MKIRKNIQFYVSKKCYGEKHVGLLLIGEEGKRHYVLITRNLLSCMIILHIVKKHFCHYYLQAICKEETLQHHIKD